MCQLSFINLNDEELNKTYLWTQAFMNTLKEHRDGFGYFTEESGVFKFLIPPVLCTNAGELIRKNLIGNSPVIGHVRKASISTDIPKKDNVVIANVHPFENEHLVFAHNGTLEFKDEEKLKQDKYKNKIDSKIFLTRLTELYVSRNKSFVSSLKATMEEFTGKFAFLIYEKSTKRYYIVRGDTALLHEYKIKYNGKNIGFVVNTERESLVRGLVAFSNFLQVSGLGEIEIEDTNIKLLERESIFLFDRRGTGFLKKIDSITENRKVYARSTTYRETGYNNVWVNAQKLDSVQTKLFGFCHKWDISIYYLNEIILSSLGISLLQCDKADLEVITEFVIPGIEKKAGKSKHIKKAWTKLRNETSFSFTDLSIHQRSDISFPYMLETDVKKIKDFTEEAKAKGTVH